MAWPYPGDYSASSPRPLVIALHPGGGGTPYYGDRFMRTIVLPGLRDSGPIMIAPDGPTRAWTDPQAEQAVMALIAAVRDEFAIDRRRIAVVGFSLGGSGTWFLSARHPDLFTAAIVMAGRSEEPLASLAKVPTYVIHSRNDEVVPFAQAEQRAGALERMGRPSDSTRWPASGITTWVVPVGPAERWTLDARAVGKVAISRAIRDLK